MSLVIQADKILISTEFTASLINERIPSFHVNRYKTYTSIAPCVNFKYIGDINVDLTMVSHMQINENNSRESITRMLLHKFCNEK